MSVRKLVEAYDPATRWGRDYGYRDDGYTLGYHRGQDIRKSVGRYSVPVDVPSLTAGKVYYVGRPNRLIELTVVVDTGRKRGRFESHSHCADPSVTPGDKVAAGERLARNAALDETPGRGVDGPHDHFVISDYWDAAWNTNRPTYDPREFIRGALTAAAGQASEEDDMPTAEEIAHAVWNTPVKRTGGDVSALQELADAKTTVLQVKSLLGPIRRTVDGKPAEVSVRQELADAKTNTILLRAQVEALTGVIAKIPGGGKVDLGAVVAAAEKGARAALSDLTLVAQTD